MPDRPRLTLAERETISRCLAANPDCSWTSIAGEVGGGRHRSTIARDVDACGGRHAYRANLAHELARVRACRPRRRLASVAPEVLAAIVALIDDGWSPAPIVMHLRAEGHSGVPCAETMYQAAYRRELTRSCGARPKLRTGRTRRKPRCRVAPANWRAEAPNIATRTASAADRSEIGHWEGDLIIGAGNRSAAITLVERVSRFALIGELPDGYRLDRFESGLGALLDRIPWQGLRTLTWDQGSEMACWRDIAGVFGIDVYLADPHSPWQRGSNENTNRQIRYWLPRGTDLSTVPRSRFDHIEGVVNLQPRRLHGWRSAHHVYSDLIAAQ